MEPNADWISRNAPSGQVGAPDRADEIDTTRLLSPTLYPPGSDCSNSFLSGYLQRPANGSCAGIRFFRALPGSAHPFQPWLPPRLPTTRSSRRRTARGCIRTVMGSRADPRACSRVRVPWFRGGLQHFICTTAGAEVLVILMAGWRISLVAPDFDEGMAGSWGAQSIADGIAVAPTKTDYEGARGRPGRPPAGWEPAPLIPRRGSTLECESRCPLAGSAPLAR